MDDHTTSKVVVDSPHTVQSEPSYKQHSVVWEKWSAIGSLGAALMALMTSIIMLHQNYLWLQANHAMLQQVSLSKTLEICESIERSTQRFRQSADLIVNGSFPDTVTTVKEMSENKSAFSELFVGEPVNFRVQYEEVHLELTIATLFLGESSRELILNLRSSTVGLYLFAYQTLQGDNKAHSPGHMLGGRKLLSEFDGHRVKLQLQCRSYAINTENN